MTNTFAKELEYIKNERYKKNAQILIDLLPDYFYEVPASSTGKYHPSFALGEGGLVRHTKVAVKLAHELSQNQVIGYSFNEDEKDLMIIALIMHDGLKHGKIKEKYVRFDHPILMANYIKENKDKTTFTNEENCKFKGIPYNPRWNDCRDFFYNKIFIQSLQSHLCFYFKFLCSNW